VREIVVEPLGLRVPVGADGRFTVRGFPAGELTLHAGTIAYRLTMPRTPASIEDVELSKIRTGVASADSMLYRQ